ncbi:MAG: 30S ribosomal protein S12 methylthiotransferase RimO [Clostridia bacterium]|nr:30S ribosomal protein S12 methylthiotransferase RimO [Clostridia bacterium]
MKIGFVSLGCSKNLVDTEMMIGLFEKHGFEIVNNPSVAEIILINTCGFIESAKQEAINTILEMSEYKKKKCQYIIATGCLVKRYKEELKKAIPEVDLWIGCNDYENFWREITALLSKEETKEDFLDYKERKITTGEKMAYLKIAEGCSNHCTYCAIPMIRGPFISRKKEDIIKEAKNLANKGIQELIIIAQDTTKYGIDLYGKSTLTNLLKELSEIEEIKWIRFLYSYPETITDELIQIVKHSNKICHYFDIPIQHISNPVLKRMNRHSNEKSIREIISKIRKEIPDVIIRSTVMVGFPGETKEDFEKLYNFIKETEFDKLGAFTYSKEEGTAAEKLKEQLHPQTKKSRYHKIMQLQQEISKNKLKEKIGKVYEVLIESISFDGKYYIGRTYMDVPDTDGVVFIKNIEKKKEHIGQFVNCKIIEVQEYDLIAQLV